jgi:hypothetical protein
MPKKHMRKRPSTLRKNMVGKFGFDVLSLWLLDSLVWSSSLKWTHSQLSLRSHLSQRSRGVNSWNGFIKAKLREVNEGKIQSIFSQLCIDKAFFIKIVNGVIALSLPISLLTIRMNSLKNILASHLLKSMLTMQRFLKLAQKRGTLLERIQRPNITTSMQHSRGWIAR